MSHFYDARAWVPRNYVFANKDAFEALAPHARNCLRASALLAEAAGTARARELAGWYLTQLAANGMTVEVPGARACRGTLGHRRRHGRRPASWADTAAVAAAGAEGAAIIAAFEAE